MGWGTGSREVAGDGPQGVEWVPGSGGVVEWGGGRGGDGDAPRGGDGDGPRGVNDTGPRGVDGGGPRGGDGVDSDEEFEEEAAAMDAFLEDCRRRDP